MVNIIDKKSQKEKFEEAAREHEADESESAFDANLKKIAKASLPQKGSKPVKN